MTEDKLFSITRRLDEEELKYLYLAFKNRRTQARFMQFFKAYFGK